MRTSQFVDTITYFTFIVGIARAGHIVFPISPRNSAAAVAHLIRGANISHILVGAEKILEQLANESLELLQSVEKPSLHPMPTFDDIFRCKEEFVPLSLRRPNIHDPGVILHSSGSTAFPKPILFSHYRLMLIAATPCASS